MNLLKKSLFIIYQFNKRDDLIQELIINPYVSNILDRIESTFLSCSQILQCASTDRKNI